MYEVITNELGSITIKYTNNEGEVFWIPTDPANSDYQAYLASLAEEEKKETN
jgi:hypothetical protein